MERWAKRRLLYRHVGEFLREVAVLVIVFGILASLIEKDLRGQPRWVLGCVIIASLTFGLGHRCGIEAEESEDEQR
jgi:hypothetical protein